MSVEVCPDGTRISEFDYQTQRKKNIEKIGNYYDKVLTNYTNKYQIYANKKYANDTDEQENADYLLKERGNISKLNTHMIDIKRNVNNLILDDFSDIKKQLKEINKIEHELTKGRQSVKELNLKLSEKENNLLTYSSNLKDTKNAKENESYYYNVYLASMGLLIVIICILSYLIINPTTYTTTYTTRNNNKNVSNNSIIDNLNNFINNNLKSKNTNQSNLFNNILQNTNTNKPVNTNTNTNTNKPVNTNTNTNTNKPVNTNTNTNINKPVNTNTNTNINKPVNTNTNTKSNNMTSNIKNYVNNTMTTSTNNKSSKSNNLTNNMINNILSNKN